MVLPVRLNLMRAGMPSSTVLRSAGGRASWLKVAVLAYHLPLYSITGSAPSGVGSEPITVLMASAILSSERPLVELSPPFTVTALVKARDTALSSRCLIRFWRVRPKVVMANSADMSAAPRA